MGAPNCLTSSATYHQIRRILRIGQWRKQPFQSWWELRSSIRQQTLDSVSKGRERGERKRGRGERKSVWTGTLKSLRAEKHSRDLKRSCTPYEYRIFVLSSRIPLACFSRLLSFGSLHCHVLVLSCTSFLGQRHGKSDWVLLSCGLPSSPTEASMADFEVSDLRKKRGVEKVALFFFLSLSFLSNQKCQAFSQNVKRKNCKLKRNRVEGGMGKKWRW